MQEGRNKQNKTPNQIAAEVDQEISGIEFEFSSDETKANFLEQREKYKDAVRGSMDYAQFIAMEYAERWARLMQARKQTGANLDDKKVIEGISKEADKWGISAGIFGMAARVLVRDWKHGDILARVYAEPQAGNQARNQRSAPVVRVVLARR